MRAIAVLMTASLMCAGMLAPASADTPLQSGQPVTVTCNLVFGANGYPDGGKQGCAVHDVTQANPANYYLDHTAGAMVTFNYTVAAGCNYNTHGGQGVGADATDSTAASESGVIRAFFQTDMQASYTQHQNQYNMDTGTSGSENFPSVAPSGASCVTAQRTYLFPNFVMPQGGNYASTCKYTFVVVAA